MKVTGLGGVDSLVRCYVFGRTTEVFLRLAGRWYISAGRRGHAFAVATRLCPLLSSFWSSNVSRAVLVLRAHKLLRFAHSAGCCQIAWIGAAGKSGNTIEDGDGLKTRREPANPEKEAIGQLVKVQCKIQARWLVLQIRGCKVVFGADTRLRRPWVSKNWSVLTARRGQAAAGKRSTSVLSLLFL